MLRHRRGGGRLLWQDACGADSAECVLLAGLPNAPSAYSPHSSPELALKRSQVVLDRMVSCKKLTKTQARELQDEIAALPVLART